MSGSWTQTWDPPDKHNVIAAVAKDDLNAGECVVTVVRISVTFIAHVADYSISPKTP